MGLLKSYKKRGKFEKALIEHVSDFFQEKGYSVSTHTRLNIAWSPIISDVDVVAVLREEIVIAEVKSNHDNLYYGFQQLQKVKGFANKLYIATDRNPQNIRFGNWRDDSIGLLHIDGSEVEVVRSAKNLNSLPEGEVLIHLRKKCLIRLARLLGIPAYLSKRNLEHALRMKFLGTDLKIIAERIALCHEDCESDCILEPFFVTMCEFAT